MATNSPCVTSSGVPSQLTRTVTPFGKTRPQRRTVLAFASWSHVPQIRRSVVGVPQIHGCLSVLPRMLLSLIGARMSLENEGRHGEHCHSDDGWCSWRGEPLSGRLRRRRGMRNARPLRQDRLHARGRELEALLLAPAHDPRDAQWVVNNADALAGAEQRLRESVACLHTCASTARLACPTMTRCRRSRMHWPSSPPTRS